MTLIDGLVAGHILESLARYKFLTVAQFVRLKVGSEKTVRQRLAELETAKRVAVQEFRLGRSAGRLPNVYWLTTQGAKLAQEATGIKVPPPRRNLELSPNHVAHRILTVDTLIAADQWANETGQTDPDFRTYMQREGKIELTALTLDGKAAAADAIISMTDTAGNHRVYVAEVYCSQYSRKHSTFTERQLEPYVKAGNSKAFDAEVGATGKAARVLVICDTPELKEKLIRVLPQRAGMPPVSDETWRRLHFKAAGEIGSFGENWQLIDGRTVNLPA